MDQLSLFAFAVLSFVIAPWAAGARTLPVPCPPPIPNDPPDPSGYLSPESVAALMGQAYWLTLLLCVAAVSTCYLMTRQSTGPAFQKRWIVFLLGSTVLAWVMNQVLLRVGTVRAAASACTTDPSPFPAHLPGDFVHGASLGAALVTLLLVVLFSLIATRVIGRRPWARGFYHNRGVPLPRMLPGGE